jgi:hypothetical protein
VSTSPGNSTATADKLGKLSGSPAYLIASQLIDLKLLAMEAELLAESSERAT